MTYPMALQQHMVDVATITYLGMTATLQDAVNLRPMMKHASHWTGQKPKSHSTIISHYSIDSLAMPTHWYKKCTNSWACSMHSNFAWKDYSVQPTCLIWTCQHLSSARSRSGLQVGFGDSTRHQDLPTYWAWVSSSLTSKNDPSWIMLMPT